MNKKTAILEEKISKATPMSPDVSEGLSTSQVSERIEAGLTNKTGKHPTKTYAQIIFDNVFNYINIILFCVFVIIMVAGLSFKYCFFMVILGANTIIGLYQDIHARRLIDKLKVVSNPKATVIREGKEQEIAAEEVVLSDVVCYKLGDQILADGVVLDGECQVDESLLTGESVPVDKKAGDTLLSGTYVTKGTVKALVTKVGMANYAETLQGEASVFQQPKSEIRRSVNSFCIFTGTVAIVMGLAMYLVYGFQSGNWIGFFKDKESVRYISSSMVAMLPTGMFLLTSTTLAVGVIVLARKKMLVQQLYCIEMLARVDVLCFDKTGTLTDGKMAVSEVITSPGKEEEIKQAVSAVLGATKDSNATANALRDKFGESIRKTIAVLPFDSSSKYSAVTLDNGTTYAFGAFGFLPTVKSEETKLIVEKNADEGKRVIIIGRSDRPISDGKAPKSMQILGVVTLSDHIKEDAAANIAWFQNNDVLVRIISGDDPRTVSEIAHRVGVKNADKCISLEGKSIEEVKALANDYVVFGRVSPEQKAALVTSIKEQGHKVAMTGDGVNDILALKVADCSIAMASGSDAAKSVAHLISLNNDFSRLPDVVGQGRRVINNLQRTCSLFLNKTFFALILSTLFLVLQACLGAEGKYPFTSANLFVWEFVTIGISAFFLALQPSNDRLKGAFLKNIILRSIPAGITEALAGLLPLLFFLVWPQSFTYLYGSAAYKVALCMSVILFTSMSVVVLFRVCWPFTKYRFIVFISAAVFVLAFFIIDGFGGLHLPFVDLSFDVTYQGMTWGFPLLASLLFLGLIGIYALLDRLFGLFLEHSNKEISHEN